MSQLLPFLHQEDDDTDSGSGENSLRRANELPFSLDPSLSFSRKRDCPTSESLVDGQNKRFHEFTDGQGPASEIWDVRSSPPLPPGLDTDEDEIDQSFELHVNEANENDDETQQQPMKKRFLGTGIGIQSEQSDPSYKSYSKSSEALPASRSTSYILFKRKSLTASTSIPSATVVPATPVKSTDTVTTLFSPSCTSPKSRELSLYTHTKRLTTPTGQVTKAREIIANAIDEGNPKIILSNMDLDEVPAEIGDLQNLVLLNSENNSGCPDFHIFLNGNNLKTLPKALFDVSNITVLSVRANQLDELPPSIGRLHRLVNLSISQNNIHYLPCELLDLKYLDIFTCNANHFIHSPGRPHSPPHSPPISQNSPTKAQHPVLVATSTTQITFPLRHVRYSQSLVELCLDQISNHVISEREVHLWDLVPGVKDLVSRGIESSNNGTTCGICHHGMVHGIGYVTEWWSNFKGLQEHLPFRRNLCSFRCYDKWTASLSCSPDSRI